MSVKVHEPVCEDSAQDLYIWFDHFLGDQIKDEWQTAGTVTVVDAQDGGIIRITTGAVDGNSADADWGNIRSLLVSKKVTMETRVKTLSASDIRVTVGLFYDTNDNAYFTFDTDAAQTNWYIHAESGGQVESDSGVAVDTDYHIFRIEAFPTGEIHFYIDDVETANSPITTNITSEYLQPFFFIVTRENATKSIDVDYVVVRQER